MSYPQDMVNQALARQYSNVAGLTLLAFDHALTWDREVRCIWSRRCPWFSRLSFVVCRYFALAEQTINVVFSSTQGLKWQNGDCRPWVGFQMVSSYILLWNMELVMIARVYALYNRSPWVGVPLVAWFALCCGFNAWTAWRTTCEVEIDELCNLQTTPDGAWWFSLLVIVNQGILWSLTYLRHRTASRDRWPEHPIVQLVMNDSTWAALVFTGLLLSLLPYDLYVKTLTPIILSILVCTISIVSNRLILNALSLDVNVGDLESEVTTVLSVDSI